MYNPFSGLKTLVYQAPMFFLIKNMAAARVYENKHETLVDDKPASPKKKPLRLKHVPCLRRKGFFFRPKTVYYS